MPRRSRAAKNRRIETLIASNIKLFLHAARPNGSAMDKAGRKFLLSLILKNSGTYAKLCTYMSYIAVYTCIFSNPES